MKLIACWAIAVLLLPMTPAAQEPASRAELREQTQRQLAAIADGLDGVMGFVVIDIASGERFERMAAEAFPLASTIKLAILYEMFRQADEGLSEQAGMPVSLFARGFRNRQECLYHFSGVAEPQTYK
jgi:beta-lactamase class A